MIKKVLAIAFAITILSIAIPLLLSKGDILLWKMRPLKQKVVYFVPGGREAPATAEEFARQTWYLCYKELEEAFAKRGYQMNYSKLERLPFDADYLLVMNQDRTKESERRLKAFPKGRKVAFVVEPPIIEPEAFTAKFADQFAAIYTLSNSGEYRLHFPHDLKPLTHWPDFAEKKLCTLMGANKDFGANLAKSLYRERRKAITYFEQFHPESFTFYGFGWNGDDHPTYGGAPPFELKRKTISHYRFSICYENSVEPGNITEKIFDSFCAGCVPVYWGAPDIADQVPKDCFIDRHAFADLDALYAHLDAMGREEYEGYLNRIRLFLASEQAALHSFDSFTAMLVNAIDALD